MPLVARANVVYGDVNGDGEVNISDITRIISYVLTGDATSLNLGNADINGDGQVNITDVTGLITAVLKGTPITPPVQEHEWVDLGLPSGTLWATCNVGASAPEEYGDYFAWGETEPKEVYSSVTYRWIKSDDNYFGLTKYCNQSDNGYNGFTDGKTELDPEDDAAYVNWGPSWRMPSKEQINELVDNCNWFEGYRNNVYGQFGMGPNGNYIFFPLAGYHWDEGFDEAGSWGDYWSRTLGSTTYRAYYLHFSSVGVRWRGTGSRHFGYSVRAVRVQE